MSGPQRAVSKQQKDPSARHLNLAVELIRLGTFEHKTVRLMLPQVVQVFLLLSWSSSQ